MSDAHRAELTKLEGLYQENPEGRIFAHLAEAYRKGGELDRAHQVLAAGLERHPDYSSAHVVRGRVLMDQDRAEEAENAFRRVLDLDPQNLIAIRSLGDLARSRGDDDQALEFFHRLLEQEPGEDEVREIVNAMTGGPTGPAGEETAIGIGAIDSGREDFEGGEDDTRGREDDSMTGIGAGSAEEPDLYPVEERDSEPADLPVGEEDRDAGLRTETIAQVYARQGLYDRAAEVYRELSRSRPDDEALRERLAEMEQLADAQTSGSEVDAVSDFTPDETEPVPGLESTAPGPEPEEAEPQSMELEGLQAGELDTSEVEAAALTGLEAEESDPETGLRGDAAPDTAEPDEALSDELDVRDVPEPPEEAPWSPEGVVERSEPEPPSEALSGDEPSAAEAEFGEADTEAEGAELIWAGVDWREEPAETAAETPHAWTDEEEEEDASPPIGDYFNALLHWPEDGERAAIAAPAEGGAEKPGQPVESEPLQREELAAAGEELEAEPRPQVPESLDDDDDLDMFRSWLESLKQ